MITSAEIKKLVTLAETIPALMKDLKNTQSCHYWLDKYLRFEDMVDVEFGEIAAVYNPWSLDLHCYVLYTSKISNAAPGKAVMFQALADAHKDSILNDLKEIEEYLNLEFEDFYGVM